MNNLSEVTIEKPITLLIDGSGEGITKDIPVYIVDGKMCRLQGEYYCKEIYPKKKVLANYIYEDLRMFYPNIENFDKMISLENTEFVHILGLITISHGVLSICKKEKQGIKMYYEHPECHMHPNRQSILANWFLFLNNKYNTNV